MLRSTKKLAIGAVAALIGSTAISGAALVSTADASSVTRHIKFVATSDRNHGLGRVSFTGTEIERNHGRFVGYDVITGTFHPSTEQVKIYIAISRKGGMLFGRVHSLRGDDSRYSGVVTGGSGRFAGATGTIKAQNAPHNDSRTFVDILYTLR
jgi:hypothetical protein